MKFNEENKRLRDILVPEGTKIRNVLRKTNRLLKSTNSYNIKRGLLSLKVCGFYTTLNKVKNIINPLPPLFSQSIEYTLWIKNNEPKEKDLQLQKNYKFKNNPKISIIVPMYKTSFKFFKELVNSILNQTYSNWELCLADGSPKKNLKIEKLCKTDARIKYNFLDSNKGISGNTNEALAMATGDYIALLDHDDILPPFSLYEIVKCINENPDVEFIYSDEDNIDEANKFRFNPHFKPDFAIDTLRGQNYICHFSIFRKDLMDKLGGLRSKYDGSQDHDLVLRMSELTDKIIHISKILYHWRFVPNSFSNSIETLPLSDIAGKQAVKDHLDRLKIPADVSAGKFTHSYEVKYKIIGNPKISIIIPNKDLYSSLKKCIDSITKLSTYKNYEIIIVENNSVTKKIFKYYNDLKKDSRIKILYYKEKEFNYSKIINFGVKNSTGDYILQLNNDVKVLTPNWLEKMLGFAQREDVGIVGAKMYFPDMSIQHAGVIIGGSNIAFHVFRNLSHGVHGYFVKDDCIQNLSCVTGACLMCSRKIYEQVGYMNEDLKVNYNDVDFCLKVRTLNKLIVYTPFAELIHYESKTRQVNSDFWSFSKLISERTSFQKIWGNVLAKGDPYYNKNFNLDSPFYNIKNKITNYNKHSYELAIIILNYNNYSFVKKYIDLIYNYKSISKILIVDNKSTDNSFEFFKLLENEKIEVIQSNDNKGYGYGYNFGLKYLDTTYNSKYKYVILSSSAIQIEERMILKCLEELKNNKKIAIIAPKIYLKTIKPYKFSSWKEKTYWMDVISSLFIFKILFYPIYKNRLYNKKDFTKNKLKVDCISKDFCIINAKVIKKVNYFDENVFSFYQEDIISKRLRDNNYNIYSLNNTSCIDYKNDDICLNLSFFKREKLLNKSKLYYHINYNNIGSFKISLLKFVNFIRLIELIPKYIIIKLFNTKEEK